MGLGRIDAGDVDDSDPDPGTTEPAAASPSSSQQRLRARLAWLPREVPWTAVHMLTLVAGAGVLLVANRNQWFFGDEWAFMVRRGPGLGDMHLFRPHNEHWVTVPLLVYWALLSTVGLTSYLPYAAVVVVFHLALTHLLWRACLRVGARPAIATAFAAVFAVLGAGSENLLWAFQMGFVAAVAFGWGAILLHDHDGPFGRRDMLGWVASLLALMSSGPGLVMVGIAVFTIWLRRRRLVDTALAASVPACAFVVWYLIEGHHARRPPTPAGSEWGVVDWTWNGLTHAVEKVVGVPETGGVLLVVLIGWWVMHTDLVRGRTAIAFAGALGALGFYLMTAFGRVGLGLESATASRYVYIAAALLMPSVALIVSRSVPEGFSPTVAVLGLTALVAFHNVALLRTAASDEMLREQSYKAYVLETAEALRAGQSPGWHPPNLLNPDLNDVALRRLLTFDWLP